jgi:hypothetical protein
MMKRFITAALLTAGALNSFGQDVNKLIAQTDVERIIKTLAADDLQGRGSFTPGIDKAATFIEGEFKAAGLKPLQGASGYRQNFDVVRTTPVNAQVVINDTAVPATDVFALTGNSFKWSSPADAEIVTIPAGANFRAEFGKYAQSTKKTLVLVDASFKDIFKRYAGHFGQGGVDFDADTTHHVVFALNSAGKVNTLNVNYEVKTEKQALFNVVGTLSGKTKPNEYVIFSGHYDHLGILSNQKIEGDSIANGADDDASGTTAVISLAKYYKKLGNNQRTLIFVAFTAEEIGGYGSQYFSKQVDPDKTIAMFNIEMIGKASKFGTNSAFITGYERSDFGKILQANLKGTAFTFHPDPYPEQNLFYRSDNATLAKFGVPAHTISTDQIDSDKLYHTVKDEFGSLDVNNITATIRAIALSSRSIVAGKDAPTRIPKLEE